MKGCRYDYRKEEKKISVWAYEIYNSKKVLLTTYFVTYDRYRNRNIG